MSDGIPFASIYDFCPDLKSLSPEVISLLRFAIFHPDLKSLKLPLFIIHHAPICNSLTAPFCNPEFFFSSFRFSHFGTEIWTWIFFDFVIPVLRKLVWDFFGKIPKTDFGFNEFNPSHWRHHHLALFWHWNSDMNNSWLSRLILMKLVSQTFGMPAKKTY